MPNPKQKKIDFGDYTDPENPWVRKLPHWDFVMDRFSKGSRSRVFYQLVKLLHYLENEFNTTILDATSPQLYQYFKQVIDKKQIKKKTKKAYFYYVAGYYEHVKKYKKDIEGITIENPMPSISTINFKGKEVEFDIKLLQSDTDQLLSMDDIKKLIEHIYYTEKYYKYIIVCLIAFNGARVSEICHVKYGKISFRYRWIVTHVKSKETAKRDGIYFYPKFFQKAMYNYRNSLLLEHEDPEFLFPARGKTGHTWTRTIQKCLKKATNHLGITAPTNPHSFRDFLNTKRKEMGLGKTNRRFLINQKQGDINPEKYLKKYRTGGVLRDMYDDYNPFKKYILPEPKL